MSGPTGGCRAGAAASVFAGTNAVGRPHRLLGMSSLEVGKAGAALGERDDGGPDFLL